MSGIAGVIVSFFEFFQEAYIRLVVDATRTEQDTSHIEVFGVYFVIAVFLIVLLAVIWYVVNVKIWRDSGQSFVDKEKVITRAKKELWEKLADSGKEAEKDTFDLLLYITMDWVDGLCVVCELIKKNKILSFSENFLRASNVLIKTKEDIDDFYSKYLQNKISYVPNISQIGLSDLQNRISLLEIVIKTEHRRLQTQ